jgi:maltooligosyltrehalose trehalohydrolase
MRKLPVGAEPLDGGVHFRVWAPEMNKVEVVQPGFSRELENEGNGYFSAWITEKGPGDFYRFRLNEAPLLLPDPASRFQPEGPHGPSQIIDPGSFPWSDEKWEGIRIEGQVIYEMHPGTFTAEGTWESAERELAELFSAGITVLEIMPVADFPGRFGWGYDGVDFFAPTRLYGTPDEFRHFVNRAHEIGLGVILDVVYNHSGPDGNYLPQFSKFYYSERYENEWGQPFNFDGENSGPVREFFIANACHWISEFHIDGLRIDAAHSMYDSSPEHILAELTRECRRSAGERSIVVISENEPQQSTMLRPPEQGGYGMDGAWNDDFHHCALVSLSGSREAYFTDYFGSPQEFISLLKWGYLYQGQYYSWQKKRRGEPTFGINPSRFIHFLDNHDQVANEAFGRRAYQRTSPSRFRALTALLLLAPNTPMLFQGQEFNASSPFLYFADHGPELAKLVREGRREFLSQFRSQASPEMVQAVPDPFDANTFESCKLDFTERQKNERIYAMHRDLLKLRRDEPALRIQRSGSLDGAVLGPSAFVLRFFGESEYPEDDRLLLVNLGALIYFSPAPEPLLAPPLGASWQVAWSSEDPRYGGGGTVPPLDPRERWVLAGETALLLAPTVASTNQRNRS